MVHPALTMAGQLGLHGPIAAVPVVPKPHPYVRKDKAKELIMDYLETDGPSTAQEISDSIEVCLVNVQQYCRHMADNGILTRSGRKPIYYGIPSV